MFHPSKKKFVENCVCARIMPKMLRTNLAEKYHFHHKLFTTTKRFTKDRPDIATVVAYLDRLEHKESLASQENQASPALQATLDSPVKFLLNIVRSRPNHLAIHAHQVQLAQLALQAKMANPEIRAKTAVPAKMVHQAQPAHQAHQAVQEHQAQMDPEVTQAEMLAEVNHSQVTKVQMAQMENQAQQVLKEMQAKMAAKAQTDPKVHQVQLAMEAKTVNPETKVHQATQAKQEKRVSAPNIVPSMVEFSSKMAQDDKHWAPTPFFIFCYSLSNLRLL